MLFLPLVFVDLSSDRISIKENRMLAERPKLADIKNHPRHFVRQFDDWFKDSTGFREQLLALYNVVSKNKWLNNNVQYSDGQYVYLIGEQGHHYFAEVEGRLIPFFQGKPVLSDEKLANMANKLEMVKTYLDSKGIPLVVMLCTDKESVYPEFYPKSIKRGPEPIQLDIITDYLKDHTSADVFNIKKALLAEKDNYLLYNVSSGDLTHYNVIGAFFAYRELMKHINIHFPQLFPFELGDIEISYNENGIPHISLKTEKTYKALDPSFFDDVNLPFTSQSEVYENINPNLPVILCFRDSYLGEEFVGKYIARHFGKTILIHYYINIDHIDEYITKYKPDIVLFESAERQLGVFADTIIGIPDLPITSP